MAEPEPPAPSAPPTTLPQPPWAVQLEDQSVVPVLHEIEQTVRGLKINSNNVLTLTRMVESIEQLRSILFERELSRNDTTHILQTTTPVCQRISLLGRLILKNSYANWVDPSSSSSSSSSSTRGPLHEQYLRLCVWFSVHLITEFQNTCMSAFLILCVDSDCNYYRAQYDVRTRVSSTSREQALMIFTDYVASKYESIVDTLCSTPFIGADNAGDILTLLNQLGPQCTTYSCPHLVDSDTAHAAAVRFMTRFKECTDDDLKMRLKKNEKSLEPVWFQLETLCGHPGTVFHRRLAYFQYYILTIAWCTLVYPILTLMSFFFFFYRDGSNGRRGTVVLVGARGFQILHD